LNNFSLLTHTSFQEFIIISFSVNFFQLIVLYTIDSITESGILLGSFKYISYSASEISSVLKFSFVFFVPGFNQFIRGFASLSIGVSVDHLYFGIFSFHQFFSSFTASTFSQFFLSFIFSIAIQAPLNTAAIIKACKIVSAVHSPGSSNFHSNHSHKAANAVVSANN
jgi:hypothetical protein